MENLNNLNAVNDAQEVNVEPQNTPIEETAKESAQTKQANSAFAGMRRRESLAVNEKERVLKENNALKEKLSQSEAQSNELMELRQYKSNRIIEDDIALIKKEYPEFNISAESLPEEFIRIMATGAVDALTAAEIIMARKRKEKINPPKEIGAVNESSAREKDFYTPDEVDRLTKEDFKKNPGLLKKVQRSMTKWR